MYLNCTTEKSAAYQRMLEKCMMDFMQNTLVEDISISSLCQHTGISRKTFYRLFSSKSDVILAMLDHTILDFESFTPDPSVGPGEIHRFVAFWRTQEALLDALAFNHCSALLLDRALLHVLSEAPESVHYFGAFKMPYKREMMLFYINGLMSLILDWHKSGFNRSIEDMCQLIRTLLKKVPVSWED